jgi:hypothetical protein
MAAIERNAGGFVDNAAAAIFREPVRGDEEDA